MNYQLSKYFQKDFDKLKDKDLAIAIIAAIENVTGAKNMAGISNLKKLKGYKNAYRIRIGGYRIGIILQNNTVHFMAFSSRKDIYKKFP